MVVKLGNIELEEKTESKGDKRESQDERRQYDEDTSNGRRQHDEDTSNGRRQYDEHTSNGRRQHDEDTSNGRRQYDEHTSNGRRQHDEDTSNGRRQYDEHTSNGRRQHDEDTSNDRRQYDEDTSNDRRQYEDTSNDIRQYDEHTSNDIRQYDEDTSSSTTDGIDELNTNEAERLTGQNGDDNSSNVLGISTQRNADTSGMVDNQIDHLNRTTYTTDGFTLPNNVPTATDSNNCLHSYALTDETSKETEIERFGYTIPKSNINDEHHSKVYYSTSIIQTQLDLLKQIRKYFETIDYKELTTVYKNLFCIDNLYQSLYVYPVVEAQWELNDRPRVNHPGDNTLSASGNLVCHPEEDQVSNTDRMLNVNISDNRMLNVNVSDNRIESRGGEEQTTHVSTGFQDEMSLPSNSIPARQPLGNLPDLRPITGIHGTWHINSFEGTHNNI